MPTRPLIHAVGEWLIDQALDRPDVLDMFRQTCRKLDAAGVPVARARLTWQTLHPLFRAETILWRRNDDDMEFEQFRHRDEATAEWNASPMKYMMDNDVDVLRRHLSGPHERLDFPILHDMKAQGLTDYLVVLTSLDGSDFRDYRIGPGPALDLERDARGIILTWASDREDGFADEDIEALQNIQRRFAVAVKTSIQERIARNVAETYLGQDAGRRVLSGQIKRGDGRRCSVIAWFCDMRSSTAFADTMEPDAFLQLLNGYFDVTAGAVMAHEGEVLGFIGDAVLAIFPFDGAEAERDAAARAVSAAEEAVATMGAVNREREMAGEPALRFGVGIHSGEVVLGNIGTADRLAYTAIGSVLNEVSRIESLTKALDCDVIVSERVAALDPERWSGVGAHSLSGVAKPCELFVQANADLPVAQSARTEHRAH